MIKEVQTVKLFNKTSETAEVQTGKVVDGSVAGAKVLKESKNSIRVDFERTSRWERFKIKYFSTNFVVSTVWFLFRLGLLIGISYVIIQPFFSKIMSSFMSSDDFVDVTVKLIPRYPTLNTYKAIFTENGYFEALLNTTVLSLLCAVVQTLMCCLIGYGFAKFKFKGNKFLFACVIFTMIVPHNAVKFAMLMEFKYFDIFGIFKLLGGGVFPRFSPLPFSSIDLTNTYWPLALLSLGGLAFKNGLYIYMMRQFFRGVPDELEESAYIDGSGVVSTFIRIILPLSIPMMVTIFLFAFSWQWTDSFYTGLFFTSSGPKLLPDIVAVPKSLYIKDFVAQTTYEAAIRNTCGLVIIAPLLIVYLFGQKFLVQGIERSGIVG